MAGRDLQSRVETELFRLLQLCDPIVLNRVGEAKEIGGLEGGLGLFQLLRAANLTTGGHGGLEALQRLFKKETRNRIFMENHWQKRSPHKHIEYFISMGKSGDSSSLRICNQFSLKVHLNNNN